MVIETSFALMYAIHRLIDLLFYSWLVHDLGLSYMAANITITVFIIACIILGGIWRKMTK